MPRHHAIPPDRMAVAELLTRTGISKASWYRSHRWDAELIARLDLVEDLEQRVLHTDRVRAERWIERWLTDRKRAYRPANAPAARARTLGTFAQRPPAPE